VRRGRQAFPDIRLDRFARKSLEQREVLERGGMEDDVRPMPIDHLDQRLGIAKISEDDARRIEQGPAFEHELHGMQRRLIAIEHQNMSSTNDERHRGQTSICTRLSNDAITMAAPPSAGSDGCCRTVSRLAHGWFARPRSAWQPRARRCCQ
jgi:hypothetical protein